MNKGLTIVYIGDGKGKTSAAASIEALKSGKYDLVVLDEALSAVESKLLTEEDVLEIMDAKPESVHLCITGHKRWKKVIEKADLVTEMKMIKHPYYQGITAQRGIDY
jgi:cob(I)alamin adenosyltransferase